eukprot:6496788-Pyramimonas_sp.AAC.1
MPLVLGSKSIFNLDDRSDPGDDGVAQDDALQPAGAGGGDAKPAGGEPAEQPPAEVPAGAGVGGAEPADEEPPSE